MQRIPSLLDLFGSMAPGRAKHFEAGDFVFRQGDPARHLYVVERGEVRLERITVEGRKVLMYRAGAGESFAEAAVLSDSYHCNAVVPVASRIIALPREAVLRAIRDDPGVAERFILLLASQVRTLRTRLELRNLLSAGDRILHFLQQSAPDGPALRLRSSLKDLAAELGLAHETLYRELARLEQQGLVSREGRRIRLLHQPGD